MTKWRLVENEWNLKDAPWVGAIGIEEDDPRVHVPAIICWFMRGIDIAVVHQVVNEHNRHADLYKQAVETAELWGKETLAEDIGRIHRGIRR